MTKKGGIMSSYQGWLISDNFLKRVFGVMGYGLIGALLVNLMLIILFVFSLSVSILFGLSVGKLF